MDEGGVKKPLATEPILVCVTYGGERQCQSGAGGSFRVGVVGESIPKRTECAMWEDSMVGLHTRVLRSSVSESNVRDRRRFLGWPSSMSIDDKESGAWKMDTTTFSLQACTTSSKLPGDEGRRSRASGDEGKGFSVGRSVGAMWSGGWKMSGSIISSDPTEGKNSKLPWPVPSVNESRSFITNGGHWSMQDSVGYHSQPLRSLRVVNNNLRMYRIRETNIEPSDFARKTVEVLRAMGVGREALVDEGVFMLAVSVLEIKEMNEKERGFI